MEKTGASTDFLAYLTPIVEWLQQLGFSFSGENAGWSSLQIALILLSFALASFGRRILLPGIQAKIASMEENGIKKVGLHRLSLSLWGVLLASSMWAMVLVMRQITWASRSHLLLSAASLATAWLVISIVTKFFKNRTLSKTVAVIAWSIAALNTLGLLPSAVEMLDGAAIQFDTFRLSILTVLKGVAVFSAMIWGALALGRFADTRLNAIEDLTPSLQVLAAKVIKAGLFIVAIMVSLRMVGIDFSALAVFSGAIGLGIGFGLQKVVSNLISGFILLTDKSIKPGDVISVGDSYGRIDQLAARYVSVRARDGREYLVPNEDLITNQVINWTFSAHKVRLDVNFGTSYNADPHLVREIAKKAAAGVKRVGKVQPPVCHITEFGDSSINYVLRFWIMDPDKGTTNIRGDVFLALWDGLKEAGVEIPYPHRQVILSEPMTATTQKAG
jgi:small-conductance mechanosensitive channel